MATIVPISHSIRWRSRSRNSSMDSVDNYQQQQQVALASPYSSLHITSSSDAADEWDEEPSDDEDASFDELQTSAWLVVPREFANMAQRSRRSSWAEAAAPVSPLGYVHSAAKSMERRRAKGSRN